MKRSFSLLGSVDSQPEKEFHHSPSTSPIVGRNKAELPNKCTLTSTKAVHARQNVKTNVVEDDEEEILSRVIKLGRAPDLLDLLCRFSHDELDKVHDSLKWLYPNLFSTVENGAIAPQMVIV